MRPLFGVSIYCNWLSVLLCFGHRNTVDSWLNIYLSGCICRPNIQGKVWCYGGEGTCERKVGAWRDLFKITSLKNNWLRTNCGRIEVREKEKAWAVNSIRRTAIHWVPSLHGLGLLWHPVQDLLSICIARRLARNHGPDRHALTRNWRFPTRSGSNDAQRPRTCPRTATDTATDVLVLVAAL